MQGSHCRGIHRRVWGSRELLVVLGDDAGVVMGLVDAQTAHRGAPPLPSNGVSSSLFFVVRIVAEVVRIIVFVVFPFRVLLVVKMKSRSDRQGSSMRRGGCRASLEVYA